MNHCHWRTDSLPLWRYHIFHCFYWVSKKACLWTVFLDILYLKAPIKFATHDILNFILFLARLNNVHGELLYYSRCRRWCWWRHPQMLKLSFKFWRPHYFLTLSLIWFIFGVIIHTGSKFCVVPSPPPKVMSRSSSLRIFMWKFYVKVFRTSLQF